MSAHKRTPPQLDFTARRIGLIARDYNIRFPNGHRDFSYVLPDVLTLLDNYGCDVALFSLYSIARRRGYAVLPTLSKYSNLKVICLEEFCDCHTGRKAMDNVLYYQAPAGWAEYRFRQAFGRVNWVAHAGMLRWFAQRETPRRIFGNCCLIICGEVNGVKYDKIGSKMIIDPHGIAAAIPPNVDVILNPQHDRTSRFEMPLKRQALSVNGRTVITVWNRGKRDKRGRTRDGNGAPWSVFRDGCLQNVRRVDNDLGIEVGILSLQ